MLQHPAFYAAFRAGTKTYFRQEPIVRPAAHVAACFGVLIVASIASLFVGHAIDRTTAEKGAQLMATFAVPSAMYGAEWKSAEVAQDEQPAVETGTEVSAR